MPLVITIEYKYRNHTDTTAFFESYKIDNNNNNNNNDNLYGIYINKNNKICECRRSDLLVVKNQLFLNELNRTTCDLHNTLRRSKGQKVYSVSLYGKDQRYYHLLECKKPFTSSTLRYFLKLI